jgi:hypothetical protein
MFAGAVEYPAGALPVYDCDEYVMWGWSAHRDCFGSAGATDDIALADARAAVIAQMADWSPGLRYLVERSDGSSLTSFAVKSSVPIPPWTTCRVTLLGDALHNMTPFRGIGAHTALRDAAGRFVPVAAEASDRCRLKLVLLPQPQPAETKPRQIQMNLCVFNFFIREPIEKMDKMVKCFFPEPDR